MNRSAKLFLVSPSLVFDGDIEPLRHLCRALKKLSVEVHILSGSDQPPMELSDAVLHLIPAPHRFGRGIIYRLCLIAAAPWALLLKLRSGRPLAVVVFDTWVAALLKPVVLISRSPLILILDGAPWKKNKRMSRMRIRRAVALVIDGIGLWSARILIPNTQVLAREISKKFHIAEKRLNPLHYSISKNDTAPDEKEIAPYSKLRKRVRRRKREIIEHFSLPDKAFIVSTFDDFFARKNLEYVIRAISAAEIPDLCLIACGSGDEENSLLSLTVSLGLHDRIIFLDKRESLNDAIDGSDLLLVPSGYTGIPFAAAHSLRRGVPIIAARNEEYREFLGSDEMLYEPYHVEALASLLRELVQSPHKLERLRSLCESRLKDVNSDWSFEAARCVLAGAPLKAGFQSERAALD